MKKSLANLLGLFQWSPNHNDLDQWVTPNVPIVYSKEEFESMEMYNEYAKMLGKET